MLRTCRHLIALLAVLTASVTPGIAQASQGMFIQDGIAGDGSATVNAIIPGPADSVYVGGDFSAYRPFASGGGAGISTDGSVDGSFPTVGADGSGNISAVVDDGSGGFYIGGVFTCLGGNADGDCADAGETTVANLAHLNADGSVDAAWTPTTNGSVNAIAVSDGMIYVGGNFTTIGGTSRNRLAAIGTDGTLGSWNPNANGTVGAIAVSGSKVYVGGTFTTIGGTTRNRLAAIGTDGTLAAWDPNATVGVNAIAVKGTTVYVGGDFTSIGGVTRRRLAAIGTDGTLDTWNPNASDSVYALAISGTTVYAGGKFATIGGTTRNRLAAIGTDGTLGTWDPNVSTNLQYVYAIAVDGTTTYVGGTFNPNSAANTIGGAQRSFLAAIDQNGSATAWEPNPSGTVNAIAVSGDTIYAGGTFETIGGAIRKNLMQIDAAGAATSWNPGANGPVEAMTFDGTLVYAGGDFTAIGGNTRNRLAAFDINGVLASWNPGASDTIRAIAIAGSTVYVGGDFTGANSIGSSTRNHLAAIGTDGTVGSWNPNADNTVNAIAIAGSTVYVGGNFNGANSIGGTYTRNRLAAIGTDGTVSTGWNPGASNPVYAVTTSGSSIFVGGIFYGANSVGTSTRNRLAAIGTDGTVSTWDPNGSGPVYAFAVEGLRTYVGGQFGTIGTQSASRGGIAALLADGSAVSDWAPTLTAMTGQTRTVKAVAPSGANVYFGGYGFKAVNGNTQTRIGAVSATSGESIWSAPPTGPGTPTAATGTAGDAQAAVRWTAPTSDGGSAITEYTVTAAPGGATCTSATTTCTITGLANGTAYTFTVVARNGVSTGDASAPSTAVTPSAPATPETPATTPKAPTTPATATIPKIKAPVVVRKMLRTTGIPVGPDGTMPLTLACPAGGPTCHMRGAIALSTVRRAVVLGLVPATTVKPGTRKTIVVRLRTGMLVGLTSAHITTAITIHTARAGVAAATTRQMVRLHLPRATEPPKPVTG